MNSSEKNRKSIIKYIALAIALVSLFSLILLEIFNIFSVHNTFKADTLKADDSYIQEQKRAIKDELYKAYNSVVSISSPVKQDTINFLNYRFDFITKNAKTLDDFLAIDDKKMLNKDENLYLFSTDKKSLKGELNGQIIDSIFVNLFSNHKDITQVDDVFYVAKFYQDLDVIAIYGFHDIQLTNEVREKFLGIISILPNKNLFLIDSKDGVLLVSNKIKVQNQKISALNKKLSQAYLSAIKIAQTPQKEGFYIQDRSDSESRQMIFVKNIGYNLVFGVSADISNADIVASDQQERALSELISKVTISIFCLFTIVIMALLACFFIIQKIKRNFTNFTHFLNLVAAESRYIPKDSFDFIEFVSFSDEINALLEKLIKEKNHNTNELLLFKNYSNAVDEIAMVLRFSKEKTLIFANNMACKTLKYQRSEISSMSFNELIFDEISLDINLWQGVIKMHKKDGDVCYAKVSILPILTERSDISEYLLIGYDITPFIIQQEMLDKHLSDPLTSLQNRQALIDKLSNDDKYGFVANLDILRFKQINEYYGFGVGDRVLLGVSNRLLELIEGKNLELFKLTNDSFAIIAVKKFWSITKFSDFCRFVVENFEENPLIIDDNKFNISLVFGISSDVKQFITTEIAKDYAKTNKQSVVVFDDEKDGLLHTINLTQSLKKAIDDDRIVLYKQGIVDNESKKTIKYECLVRMIDEKNNVIPPLDFLRVAKRSNLYQELTKIVIETSFKYFFTNEQDFSINLAIDDILSSKLVDYLELNLIKYPGIGKRLTLEILEDESINNFEKVNEFIEKMRKYGCKIAIDDFGTGYANFEHLLRIKADFVKIDGSMIKNIDKDDESRRIVELMVDFSRRLGIKTVAEFVHSDDVSQAVKDIGIDASQGFYFDKPKPIGGE
ncbi:sensor domain-containing phosphodiesterase [Campylobacter gastrosuis]|uniref:EAL domain-containing protein n=1 Tax=Campylobacter gastrosuis TaxID=2974576 RepID=A0ABT7HRM3_9BACT|nr:EAL domain-containing protein [Campylobacter gastrosuis]MDL0089044.1 EAL domain-containing protein [Campylobacter gastrosuis]